MFIIMDMTNILDTVHCLRNKIHNLRWNECLCLHVEKCMETNFVGILRVGNTGRHLLPSCNRGVIFIDLTLLNQIVPPSTIFERQIFKVKNYNCIKIYISYDSLDTAKRCLCFSSVFSSAKSWRASISPSRMRRNHNSYVT
jgi:hypothetical protein